MNEYKTLNDFLPNNKGHYFKRLRNNKKDSDKLISKNEIVECLKRVMDPEIPVNLYDLGLIYSININNNEILIQMTLTNPNCPVASQMPENVGKSVESISQLVSIKVTLVWSPKWTKEFMSDDAKLALDIF